MHQFPAQFLQKCTKMWADTQWIIEVQGNHNKSCQYYKPLQVQRYFVHAENTGSKISISMNQLSLNITPAFQTMQTSPCKNAQKMDGKLICFGGGTLTMVSHLLACTTPCVIQHVYLLFLLLTCSRLPVVTATSKSFVQTLAPTPARTKQMASLTAGAVDARTAVSSPALAVRIGRLCTRKCLVCLKLQLRAFVVSELKAGYALFAVML